MCQPGASAMRPSASGRPRWGVLYAVVAPQLAVLALVELGGPPSALRLALRYTLALGAFVAMAAWVHTSRAALDLQDWCECAGRTMTIRVISSTRPTSEPGADEPGERAPLAEEYEPAGR